MRVRKMKRDCGVYTSEFPTRNADIDYYATKKAYCTR